jgi:hypothetical protein
VGRWIKPCNSASCSQCQRFRFRSNCRRCPGIIDPREKRSEIKWNECFGSAILNGHVDSQSETWIGTQNRRGDAGDAEIARTNNRSQTYARCSMTRLDLAHELGLRRWARANYVPAERRSATWHPIVLDEMRGRDSELAEMSVSAPSAARYVPLLPSFGGATEATIGGKVCTASRQLYPAGVSGPLG